MPFEAPDELERRERLVQQGPSRTPTEPSLTWRAGALLLELAAPGDAPVRILRLAHADLPRDTGGHPPRGGDLVELAADGDGHTGEGVAPMHRGHITAHRLRHTGHREERHPDGTADLLVEQHSERSGLTVLTTFRHRPGTRTLRSWNEVRNDGAGPVRLRYAASLNLPVSPAYAASAADLYRDLRVHVPHNSWTAELRWQEFTLEQLGLVDGGPAHGGSGTQTGYAYAASGSRSSGVHLPAGAVTDAASGHAWAWQIEHNGPWVCSLDDGHGALHVHLSGPAGDEHAWSTLLAPGETFTTVPVAVTASPGGLEGALRALTLHRRAVRRPHPDTENLPVIFNDYMNCLMGDPTTQQLLPLVEAAGELGAEYFVIDAGWYADDGGWWETVGEWRESARRFPAGLREVTDRIRATGMVPGLWVEPEVIGVRSPALADLPEEAFFRRDGRRVEQRGRYQLDFRHPRVVARMDRVIDRLVEEYGAGYLKFDYNINTGAGTDVDADSPGEGLLGHNRAFLAWLDALLDRHPGLVVENCSSGGMRMDYAQLARATVQSTSDQQEPTRYAPIAAAAPSGVTPEQGAVWAYVQPDYSDELNAFTMVSSLLGRIHLSGRVDLLDGVQRDLVVRALDVYRGIRPRLARALPRWPLGLPGWYDDWTALGLDDGAVTLLAVWRRGGDDTVGLPLPHLAGARVHVEELYPDFGTGPSPLWRPAAGRLEVTLPANPSARLFRLDARG